MTRVDFLFATNESAKPQGIYCPGQVWGSLRDETTDAGDGEGKG